MKYETTALVAQEEEDGELITWYERRGYRFVEYCDWEVTNYRSVIHTKTL